MTDGAMVALAAGRDGALKAVPLSSWALSEMTGRPTESLSVEALFAQVPVVYRCVTLRAQALSSVPFEIVRATGKPAALTGEMAAFEQKLPDLLYRMEASLCLYGAAYLMPLPDGDPVALHGTAALIWVVAAEGDPLTAAIASFGGADLLVAVEPPDPSLLRRLDAAAARQRLPVAVVGVGPDGDGITPLPASTGGRLRVNRVRVGDGASSALVAEAAAFLASDRAAGTRGATLTVGDSGS